MTWMSFITSSRMTGATLGSRPFDAHLFMTCMLEISQRLSRLLTKFTTSVYAVISKYHALIGSSIQVYQRTTKFCWRSFDQYARSITAHVFRTMFRMCRVAFVRLSGIISKPIGRDRFRSELDDCVTSSRGMNMVAAHEKGSGGYLPGEVKLAIFIRFLAGGSHYDISGC